MEKATVLLLSQVDEKSSRRCESESEVNIYGNNNDANIDRTQKVGIDSDNGDGVNPTCLLICATVNH